MADTSLTISLSEPLKLYVEAKLAAGEYETFSEYVEHLILEEQNNASDFVVKHILSGIESPDLEISDGEFATRPFGALLREKLAEGQAAEAGTPHGPV